jgi:hypothetical protein
VIDLTSESLLTFPEAVAFVPPLRRGRPPHPVTLNRWSTIGIQGVKLETVVVGNRRLTTKAAIARFIRRVTKVREREVAHAC